MSQKLSESQMRDLDYEIRFFEGIAGRRPDFFEVLVVLGDLYTRRGFHEKGLHIDARLVRLAPRDPIVRYNLACSLSLTNQIDAAFEELERAIELGFHNVTLLEQDDDLDNIRQDERFRMILAKASQPSE